MFRLSNWMFALVVVVLGSTASRVYAAALPNACSLLSPADAAALLGAPIEELSPFETETVSHCGYDPGVDDGAFLTIDISANKEPVTWARIRTPDGGDGLTQISTVAGLGDDAFLMSSGPIASVHVLKGDLIIRFGMKVSTPVDISPTLLEVARTVVSRLP